MADRLSVLAADMVAEAVRRVDPALGDLPHSAVARSRAIRAARALAEAALEAEIGRYMAADRDRQFQPPATPG